MERDLSARETVSMTDTEPFNLERFVAAQTPVFATVLDELRAGRKRTHWMWFVFPQLRGLGAHQWPTTTGLARPPRLVHIWPIRSSGAGSPRARRSC